MIYLLLFFLEIIVLFFLSRAISRNLFLFLPIRVLSFIFFPGVVVHELSHLLVATIMFVRVGEIEFKPRIIDGGLKLGSVEVARTDPVRRAIIGFAPVFIGILLVLGASFWGLWLVQRTPESVFWRFWIFDQNDSVGIKLLISAVTFYLLFVISNTMFSSKKDMEGTLELSIALLIIFTALYFVGFRFPHSLSERLFSNEIIGLIQKLSVFLLAPIIIDAFILGIIRIFRK